MTVQATITDFLQTTVGNQLVIQQGVWVRLHNNNTATDTFSTGITGSRGDFTYTVVPGDYTLYWGPSATVGGTPNVANAHYRVAYSAGDDAALDSVTSSSSGPYTNTANNGGVDVSGLLRQVMPIVADGVTDNHNAIIAWMAANIPNGGVCDLSGYAGPIATSPLDVPSNVLLKCPPAVDGPVADGSLTPRLVPAVAGQAYVVGLPNKSAAVEGFIDALSNDLAGAAQHALKVDAHTCRFAKLMLQGGTLSTLLGTTNAVEFTGTGLYIWTQDTIGGVKPIDNVGSDWQIVLVRTNADGTCSSSGRSCHWTNGHFVTKTTPLGTAPLWTDGGLQFFTDCAFDGTPGTAFIDRTNATGVGASWYTGVTFIQSASGVTGIPVFKECSGGTQGAHIVNAKCFGTPTGASTFTNFIDAPTNSTSGGFIEIPSTWLTGPVFGTPPPGGPFPVVNNANNPQGVASIVKSNAPVIGVSAAQGSVATITSPNDSAKHVYRISGAINITTHGTESFSLQVTYTDDNGAAQTATIPLVNAAGTIGTVANAAGVFQAMGLDISVNPNTSITVKTAGTFTGAPVYNVAAAIEQIR